MESPGLIRPNTTFSLTVGPQQPPTRIDTYLAQKFPSYSRTFFARLIDKNLIELNSNLVQKQSIIVRAQDTLTITFPTPPHVEQPIMAAKDLGIQVIFEHEHFLIVSKPADVIMHKPSSFSASITLADWLIATFEGIASVGYTDRPGIVHRLDKDTSGILVIARTNHAHIAFGEMFKNRTIHKTYVAVVQGHPEPAGIITLPIGRHPITRNKMTTFPDHAATTHTTHNGNGIRAATTGYTVLTYFEDCALVQAKPLTGRTHQIRVHFAALGHPIIGDAVYGKKSTLIKRQALHAQSLAFTFDDKPYSFTHEPPEDFQKLIAQLKPL